MESWPEYLDKYLPETIPILLGGVLGFIGAVSGWFLNARLERRKRFKTSLDEIFKCLKELDESIYRYCYTDCTEQNSLIKDKEAREISSNLINCRDCITRGPYNKKISKKIKHKILEIDIKITVDDFETARWKKSPEIHAECADMIEKLKEFVASPKITPKL